VILITCICKSTLLREKKIVSLFWSSHSPKTRFVFIACKLALTKIAPYSSTFQAMAHYGLPFRARSFSIRLKTFKKSVKLPDLCQWVGMRDWIPLEVYWAVLCLPKKCICKENFLIKRILPIYNSFLVIGKTRIGHKKMEAWWIGLGMVLTWIGVYIFSPKKQTTTVQLVIGCVLLGFVSHEIYLFGTNAIHRAAAQPTSLWTLSEKNTRP